MCCDFCLFISCVFLYGAVNLACHCKLCFLVLCSGMSFLFVIVSCVSLYCVLVCHYVL